MNGFLHAHLLLINDKRGHSTSLPDSAELDILHAKDFSSERLRQVRDFGKDIHSRHFFSTLRFLLNKIAKYAKYIPDVNTMISVYTTRFSD
jgi:hypothetical protein